MGISGKFLRLKLWITHCQINASYCKQAGVTYIDTPPEAVDGEGMLREDFWHLDPTMQTHNTETRS